MKILVRLPNWLGDMVMSAGALQQLNLFFPGAEVHIIVKKGLEEVVPFLPQIKKAYVFGKDEYSGLRGVWRFGRMLKSAQNFDIYISFPDSISSALMGFASGARHRTGYRKEGREIFLTHVYKKPAGLHRAEEYVHLLEKYSGKKGADIEVKLQHGFQKTRHMVVNINSEAQSRRLTKTKAIEMLNAVRSHFQEKLILIGSPGEKSFVEDVFSSLKNAENIEMQAGQTSLTQLIGILASASLVLSTDSGPAHLANALGTNTVVLFGAGNENNTSPYNKHLIDVIRLGKLSCEPCVRNVCVQFEKPQCLELLETEKIISVMKQKLIVHEA